MKNSFVLYTEYAKHIGLLDMEQRGVLFTAIMNYETEEALPEMDGITEMAFSFIKERLDRDGDKYEDIIKKRQEAGKRGGRGKAKAKGFEKEEKETEESTEKQTKANKANAFFEKQPQANKADNVLVPVPVPVNDICPSLSEREEEGIEGGSKNEPRSSETLKDLPPSSRGAGLETFLKEFSNVTVDSSPGWLSEMDFAKLSEKFRVSDYLHNRPHELSWVCKHYQAIINGVYDPVDKGKAKERVNANGDTPEEAQRRVEFRAIYGDRGR